MFFFFRDYLDTLEFRKRSRYFVNNYSVPYDYDSIMHYGNMVRYLPVMDFGSNFDTLRPTTLNVFSQKGTLENL